MIGDEAADLLASMVEDGRLPAMGVTVCDCLDVSGGLRHLLTALGASAEGDEALAAVSCLPEDVEPGVLIAAGAAAMICRRVSMVSRTPSAFSPR